MKKKLSLVLALALVLSLALTACNKPPQQAGEYTLASEISDETQSEANSVLAAFMTAFEENKPADAAPLFSSNLEASEDNISAFFEEIHKLVDAPFVPYDSYYMTGLTVSEAPLKIKKSEADANYIELAPLAEELYYAMYVSEGKKTSRMMTIILARENGEFKITWIAPTDYKYNGEDAVAVYNKTKALSDEGKLFSAYISSCKLGNIMRPGNFFRYSNDLDMEDICYKLVSEIAGAYPLPLKLDNTTDSSLYQIDIAHDDEHGVIPLICYKTSVPVDDQAAFSAESEKVLEALKQIFPDISESSEYIRFEATNDEISKDAGPISTKIVTLKI